MVGLFDVSCRTLALEFCETYLLASSIGENMVKEARQTSRVFQEDFACQAGMDAGHPLLPLLAQIKYILGESFVHHDDVDLFRELASVFSVIWGRGVVGDREREEAEPSACARVGFPGESQALGLRGGEHRDHHGHARLFELREERQKSFGWGPRLYRQPLATVGVDPAHVPPHTN